MRLAGIIFLTGLMVLIGLRVEANFLGDHNIDTESVGQHYAWNDAIGWIDFHANTTVEVNAAELRGYINSVAIGDIALNCATTPAGNTCATINFKVNNSTGNLSGWAWSDNIGWITFNCSDIGVCGSFPYEVTIDRAGNESLFGGWAWNDVIGWISFNCENDHDPDTPGTQDTCSFADYRVQTTAGTAATDAELESNVFDTKAASPFFNYITWRGTKKTGSDVSFQVAFSSVPAPASWTFTDLGVANVDEKKGIDLMGERYFRYKVVISSDNWGTVTSVVDDIIINYSP